MAPRRTRSAADNIAASLKARLTGKRAPATKDEHVPLPFVEVDMNFDALVYAVGGESGLKYGLGSFVTADHKEGPKLLLYTAARIAETIRPTRMPAIPALAFGDDPVPALRSLARRVNLTGAVSPEYRLVSAFEGTDMFLTALVPATLDISTFEAEYERYLAKQAKSKPRVLKR